MFAADSAREQTLQRAIDLMESKGDMAKAMPLFEVAARSSDKALAARALLYLGQGQERQGTERARATYERIIKEFGNQTETVAVARKRLAGLGGIHSSGSLAKRLVCADCGDGEADFSPDGRLMLKTDWDTGDLAIRDMTTGQTKRLMAKPGSWRDSDAYAESPLYSPDLRNIVYLWFTDEKTPHAELRVMANEPGSKARVLVNTPEISYYEPAAWSSDGKSVLVLIEKPDLTWQLAWVSAADGSVKVLKSLEWRIRWGGRQARSLQNVRSRPRISPDGRYIVYAALSTNPKAAKGPISVTDERIYLLAADGSSEIELVKTAGINENPTLTPDGKNLLFTSDRSGNSDLWSVAMENGRAAGLPTLVMAETGTGIRAMRMTRSGSYYYTNMNRSVEIVSIAEAGISTSAVKNVVGIRPTWSPDGKHLAFLRHRPPAGGDNYDLVIHSLETGEETRYTFNGLRTFPPQWFHDGKSVLVFVRSTGKSTGWYRVDLASKEFRQIVEWDDARLQLGMLSRDEQTIYAGGLTEKKNGGSQVDRILAIDLNTGQQKQVCRLTATFGFVGLQLSPDGGTLAIRYQDQETRRTHLARVAVDGSGYREIYTGDAGVQHNHFAWSKDGRRILFGVQQEDKNIIMAIPAEGGKAETSGFDLKAAGAPKQLSNLLNISLSSDGKRLAFSAANQVQELWAIDNLLSVLK
jgi:Tol biopolymer transport system component